MEALSASLSTEDWFHPDVSREQAQAILLDQGEEGSFLVRESGSSVGDYAISVLSAGTVHHVQIKRHDRDAFFSLGDEQVFHGLDELVKFYGCPSSNTEAILLQSPILNSPPPPDCRRHGRTNLLHRATKEGNIEIVTELVRCGHRSLDARNEEGQTAGHIAASNGFNEILSILIRAGTNVNAKDSSSYTLLHYACINNHPQTVEMLLAEGKANPQIRRNENGWVAMHEAASRGYLEVIKILHAHSAPLKPRTLDLQLPVHLAIANNHEQTIQFFDSSGSRLVETNRLDWYHGSLERKDALRVLQLCQENTPQGDTPTSFFLVRRHSNKAQVFVLTLLFQGHTYNFEIGQEYNFFFIDDGPYLDSLEEVVEHYSRWPDGLPTTLHIPVGPTQTFSQQPPRPNANSLLLETPPPLPKRIPLSISPNPLSSLFRDEANNNLNLQGTTPFSSPPSIPFCKENIASELIELGSKLGGGEYGEVYEGRLRMGKEILRVAIKTLKMEEEMQEWTKKEFLQEANVMMELEHPNIVRIIGISWSPRIFMVQELLGLGSLQDYLAESPHLIIPSNHFPTWGHQIAKGMVYLQNKRFVHRDLAARNILLSENREAKISDFGLSRALGIGSDYYTASQGGRWPIKWYAPEACSHGTFSHASDVWSYGITLWEVYSFGETPYGDETTGREVIELVDRGERLPKPTHCTNPVYNVMKKCWMNNPDLRPTFSYLDNFFASQTSNSNSNSNNDSNALSASLESVSLIHF